MRNGMCNSGGIKCIRKKAEALWGIIDDIDTLSDIIKPATEKGYKAFYDAVMKKADREA